MTHILGHVCATGLLFPTLFLCCVLGLDPQPSKNVWQSATNPRPWQTQEWQATANTGPKTATVQPSDFGRVTSRSSSSHTSGAAPRPTRPAAYYNSDGHREPSHNRNNSSKVTDIELSTLSEELFEEDISNSGKYIDIDFQARTQSNSHTDAAPRPLLSVKEEALQTPTVQSLRQLFDNYIAETSFVESVTAEESREENNFMDKVLESPVMKHAMEFLADKGYVQKGRQAQKDLLKLLWFTMYSRGGGIIGSSAFEHVFLGELKKDEVSGLHNWVFFAHEEKNQTVDYMGYLRKLDFGKNTNCLKIHYRWKSVIKPSGTLFVGTSPELEMALYTVCFLTRPNARCPVSFGGKSFGVQTYSYRQKGKIVIGSAYPTF